MRFAWPMVLPTLAIVPLLVAGYALSLRRRRTAVIYSNVALLRAAGPRREGWKRHLPFGLLVTAMVCLLAGGARPQVEASDPSSSPALILALDVSASMCATDAKPNRLTAAENAVRAFVKAQDPDLRIGLVVFSDSARLAVPPTTDRKQFLRAIETLTIGRGTTIGAAILKSVDAISTIDSAVAPPDVDPDGSSGKVDGPARPTGRYAREIVVLLTDGANTSGITPQDAAKVAAARGVRVYPIAFGTDHATNLVCTAAQLGGTGFDIGAGGFGGTGSGTTGGFPNTRALGFLVPDQPALRKVAATTGGVYYSATRADELQSALRNLRPVVEVKRRQIEITAGLAGLAALLVLLAVAAAARWTPFPD